MIKILVNKKNLYKYNDYISSILFNFNNFNIIIIDDLCDIKIDNEFSTKIENEYLSEMFSWIVQGAKEYYKNPSIEMTDEFKKRTNEILSGEDSIKTFFDRFLKITKNHKDTHTKLQLFETYRQYCNDNSQRCQPRSSLFNQEE